MTHQLLNTPSEWRNGAMNKSISYYVLPGLSDRVIEPVRWLDPDVIIDEVCKFYETPRAEFTKTYKGDREHTYKRYMCVALLMKYSRVNYEIVRQVFNYQGRHQVWFAINAAEELVRGNPLARQEYDDIKYILAVKATKTGPYLPV